MRIAMMLLATTLAAPSLAAQRPAPRPPIDTTDARAVARAVLEAYRTRDLETLAGLATQDNRSLFAEIAREGSRHPRYPSLFTGWRWDAVTAWNGQIGEVRYTDLRATVRATIAAEVLFGRSPTEVFVVSLELRSGRWEFEDILSPSPASFAEGSLSRPDRP